MHLQPENIIDQSYIHKLNAFRYSPIVFGVCRVAIGTVADSKQVDKRLSATSIRATVSSKVVAIVLVVVIIVVVSTLCDNIANTN